MLRKAPSAPAVAVLTQMVPRWVSDTVSDPGVVLALFLTSSGAFQEAPRGLARNHLTQDKLLMRTPKKLSL